MSCALVLAARHPDQDLPAAAGFGEACEGTSGGVPASICCLILPPHLPAPMNGTCLLSRFSRVFVADLPGDRATGSCSENSFSLVGNEN